MHRAIFVPIRVACFLIPTFADHITLSDYEVHDGFGFELYYN